MKKALLTLAVAVGLASGAQAQIAFYDDPSPTLGESGVFAYWNFNNMPSLSSVVEASTFTAPDPSFSGVETVSLSTANFGGGIDDFAGTTTNALGSDVSGASLSIIASATTGTPGNDTYIQFTLDLTYISGLQLSFATRGTSTGFDTGTWSYSTNGVSFTDIGSNTATRSTSFGTASVDFSAATALDNAATAYIRYTVSGASSSSGNNRIDNVQFSGTFTAVPEPHEYAMAMAGLLLTVVVMRRRRHRA